MVKNRIFALCFRAVAFVVCIIGILFNIGLFDGALDGVGLLYYTLQSNILVIILFGVLIFKTAQGLKREGKEGSCSYYPRISAGVLLCIMLTFIVFWAILAPFAGELSGYLSSYMNLSVHLICPLLMLADYILFTERGKIKKYDPLIFSIVPILYFIQATILGFAGANYKLPMEEEIKNFPYFFMDYYKEGAWVALYIVALAAFYIGLGYLLWFIDGRISRKKQESQ